MKNRLVRPTLHKDLDSSTFREYYYLKEELVNFCRENGLPVSGGKIELTDRIAYFLDTGDVLPPASVKSKRNSKSLSEISEDSIIESDFICSEKHRDFLSRISATAFRLMLLFKNG